MGDIIRIELKPEDKYNPENWMFFPDSFSYSGHVYYGSPYECADDCGTCDGAKCERCHKVYHNPEFVIRYEFVERVIKEAGYGQKVADAACSELADDFGNWPSFTEGGQEYVLVIPEIWDLQWDYNKGQFTEEFKKLCEAIGYELD